MSISEQFPRVGIAGSQNIFFIFIRDFIFYRSGHIALQKSVIVSIYTLPTEKEKNKRGRGVQWLTTWALSGQAAWVQSPAPLCNICVNFGQIV